MIILTGGTVYGVKNLTDEVSNHIREPQKKDVVMVAGKIFAVWDPSKTPAFIDAMKNNQLEIVSISVEGQLIIPGLIDVHVHAIGGGGEQGLFVKLTTITI